MSVMQEFSRAAARSQIRGIGQCVTPGRSGPCLRWPPRCRNERIEMVNNDAITTSSPKGCRDRPSPLWREPPRSTSRIWSSSTRPRGRWTTSRFRIEPRQHHRPARRQRRRQDHDDRDDHGAGAADVRPHPGARPFDAGPELGRARPDEFRKSLRRYADAADGAAEPHHFRPALCGRKPARAHRAAGRRPRSQRLPRPRQPASSRPGRRPASRWPKH